MLDWRVADGCGPTGALLRNLVGVGHAPRTGVVCWGRGYSGEMPSLNGRAGSLNKLQQLQKFKAAGILTPPFWQALPENAEDFPVLGRRLQHHSGLDIHLLLQPADAQGVHSDFYTGFVPRATEFRSWIYRRRHLGTYEKRKKAEAIGKGPNINANHRRGFAFYLVNSQMVPEGLRDIAAKAVDCLGLDFGAVDILRGVDGRFYVLEVNTAPGAESADRSGLKNLALKIQNWEKLKFPRRNGDKPE